MTEYAKKKQRQNQQIRIYQQLLRGVAHQYTGHEWRDTQMNILLAVIDEDLKDKELSEIHLALHSARKLVLHAYAGSDTHSGVKNTLCMAAAGLGLAIDKFVESDSVAVGGGSSEEHSPPPRDMDDIPF